MTQIDPPQEVNLAAAEVAWTAHAFTTPGHRSYEVHAYEMVTLARTLAAVPFTAFRWTETLSDAPLRDSQKRPGFTGVLGQDDSASLAYLTPGRTLLVVEDTTNLTPVWAGIVWAWAFNQEQHGLDVIGESVWSYWRRRLITGRTGMSEAWGARDWIVQFDDVEQFAIVMDLIAHAVATGESADLQFADVRHRPDNNPSGVTQSTIWNTYEYNTIADGVEEIARQDDGFDFVFTYEYSGTDLVIHLDLWYPRFGSLYGTTLEDGDNVTVENLERVAWDMANPLTIAQTTAGPVEATATINDDNRYDLGGDYPYLEGVYVSSEHGRDTAGLTTLGDARMLYTRGPVYTGRIDMGTIALTDVSPGDTVDFVATVNGLDVSETERVLAKHVYIVDGELDAWKLDLVDDAASSGLPRGETIEDGFPGVKTWTPTLMQGPSTNISKTVISANYWAWGELVFFEVEVQASASGTAGWDVEISLPLQAAQSAHFVAYGRYLDDSGGPMHYPLLGYLWTTVWPATLTLVRSDAARSGGGGFGTDPNIAVANNDNISMTGVYRRFMGPGGWVGP